MLTTQQLVDLLDAGEREFVVAEIMQHGKVIFDHSYTTQVGVFKGTTRMLWLKHLGVEWHLEFIDGRIFRVEMK